MAFGVTDLKKGTVFTLDGVPYKVLDYSQKVMGRGGSIVNVRIKSLIDAKVFDRTLKGGENIGRADVSSRAVQYLYQDGGQYHFMDVDNYEQFSLSGEEMENKASYIKEGENVTAQFFSGQIIGVELPKNVLLKITHAEDAVRGDTSTAITKEATTETGIKVRVPAFIKTGDLISVDTQTGAYRARSTKSSGQPE